MRKGYNSWISFLHSLVESCKNDTVPWTNKPKQDGCFLSFCFCLKNNDSFIFPWSIPALYAEHIRNNLEWMPNTEIFTVELNCLQFVTVIMWSPWVLDIAGKLLPVKLFLWIILCVSADGSVNMSLPDKIWPRCSSNFWKLQSRLFKSEQYIAYVRVFLSFNEVLSRTSFKKRKSHVVAMRIWREGKLQKPIKALQGKKWASQQEVVKVIQKLCKKAGKSLAGWSQATTI